MILKITGLMIFFNKCDCNKNGDGDDSNRSENFNNTEEQQQQLINPFVAATANFVKGNIKSLLTSVGVSSYFSIFHF